MAPTSLPELLLLCCGPYACLFPGSSIILSTTLLAKLLPYLYKCSCSNASNNVSSNVNTNIPSLPLSDSSITNNHALPLCFNGTLFGQAFYWTQVAQLLSCPTSKLPSLYQPMQFLQLIPCHLPSNIAQVILSCPPIQIFSKCPRPFHLPSQTALT
jgi:hypothetical protein